MADEAAAETETPAQAPGALPAAEGDGDGGGKMVKENETESETTAFGVIEKDQKAVNERWSTAKPPAGFEELSPFEKFAKAPDVTPPGEGAPVQLGRIPRSQTTASSRSKRTTSWHLGRRCTQRRNRSMASSGPCKA